MAAKDTPKEVQEFEAELRTIYDSKPHISASKISNLTKLAIKGVKHYKHIVHVVEKFIQKCPPEYKLSGLYVVDAICRASKSASLKDPKYYRTGGEPYGPRFAGVLPGLTGQIVTATEKDKV